MISPISFVAKAHPRWIKVRVKIYVRGAVNGPMGETMEDPIDLVRAYLK